MTGQNTDARAFIPPQEAQGANDLHARIHSLSLYRHSSAVSLWPAVLGRSTHQSSRAGESGLHGKDGVRKELDLRGKRAQAERAGPAQAPCGGVTEGRCGGGSRQTSVRFGENSENFCYVL